MSASEEYGGGDVWASQTRRPGTAEEQAAVDAFARALRAATNAAVCSRPAVGVWRQAAELAREIQRLLAPDSVSEGDRIYGQLRQFPGRAQVLVPAMTFVRRDADEVVAEMVLDEQYLGANGAAHGGVLGLVFDELLGQQANFAGRSKARTAFLRVDYRAITPIGRPVTLRAWFTEEAGRKRTLRGTAHAAGQLVAEAEGLFVALRPGQP